MDLSKRILIVEDDAIGALSLEERLKVMGYLPVGQADTVDSAVELARSTAPDLVLMDIRLKGDGDGIQAARQIHAEMDVPIIFLTAFADRATIERARVCEPFGFLTKPYSPQGLYGAIEMALDRCQIENELKMKSESLSDRLNTVTYEKNTLLVEVYHRVKNNMQVVVNLLTLQAGQTSDPQAQAALIESADRVRLLALVHESLSHATDSTSIALQPFFESICRGLLKAYSAEERIRLAIDCSGLTLPADMASPLGMIVNELAVNTLKYAFPGFRSGNIRATMEKVEDVYVFSMADDGVGVPPTAELVESSRLGLALVNNLVRQIDGQLTLTREHGSTYQIRFPACLDASTAEKRRT